MRTVPGLLAHRASRTPRTPAYCVRRDSTAWEAVDWGDFASRVDNVAAELARSGLAPGDRIGILAPTCIEWEYTQMGALRLGAVVVGIDPYYPEETRHALLRSLRLTSLVVEDRAVLERMPAEVLERIKLIMIFKGPTPTTACRVLPLQEALAGSEFAGRVLQSRPGPSADNVAIVVFSSGTSGAPKPIAFTHEQVVLAIEAIVEAFPDIAEESHFVCWLPLANLFQRIINFCAITKGVTSYMVSDPRNVMNELPSAAPSLMIGVPRFYERVREGIEHQVSSLRGIPGLLGRLALGIARRRADGHRSVTDSLLAPALDKWVLPRVRGAFGPNLRYLISGSAPMPWRLLHWYEAVGLPVYEAYGASENIIPISMNRPGTRRLGTVGQPLAPNDVRLGSDGEILVRGPGVFSGYLDSTNAQALRPDGFWATGDLGELDADGFLSVTGRKSEVFKSPGGRWIVPENIESALQTVPYIGQAVVVTDGIPGLVALACMDVTALRSRRLSRPGETARLPTSALTDSEKQALQAELRSALAELPSSERPRVVLVRSHPFTVEGGELTANLKLRRRVIALKYRSVINRALVELDIPRGDPESRETGLPLIVECE